MEYDPTTKTVSFNPQEGLLLANNGIQSPALGLYHELSHAYIQFYYPSDQNSELYQETNSAQREEQHVVDEFETPTAINLGEPTRINYADVIMTIAVESVDFSVPASSQSNNYEYMDLEDLPEMNILILGSEGQKF